ncbi:hypothetical protein ILYODFUR_036946 [Ilyodon furcidens]|uniref:Uncharacterized protein n=1 Tax=Ilyodon furcidens TaxID=33524 RepID=A0ABV0U549_9TELE
MFYTSSTQPVLKKNIQTLPSSELQTLKENTLLPVSHSLRVHHHCIYSSIQHDENARNTSEIRSRKAKREQDRQSHSKYTMNQKQYLYKYNSSCGPLSIDRVTRFS